MTNGENVSINNNYTENSWLEFEKRINEFLSSISINKIKYNKEVEEILSYNREQISHMNKKDCLSAAYLLAEYSTILQKENNMLSVKLNWAEHNMNILLGKYAKNYGDKYTSYEERKIMLMIDNTYAIALGKMILECKSRLKTLEFLSGKISTMSKILQSMGGLWTTESS